MLIAGAEFTKLFARPYLQTWRGFMKYVRYAYTRICITDSANLVLPDPFAGSSCRIHCGQNDCISPNQITKLDPHLFSSSLCFALLIPRVICYT